MAAGAAGSPFRVARQMPGSRTPRGGAAFVDAAAATRLQSPGGRKARLGGGVFAGHQSPIFAQSPDPRTNSRLDQVARGRRVGPNPRRAPLVAASAWNPRNAMALVDGVRRSVGRHGVRAFAALRGHLANAAARSPSRVALSQQSFSAALSTAGVGLPPEDIQTLFIHFSDGGREIADYHSVVSAVQVREGGSESTRPSRVVLPSFTDPTVLRRRIDASHAPLLSPLSSFSSSF